MNNTRDGFTLVEILMAIVIIGLLAGLMVPAYQLARQSRINAECANQLFQAVKAFNLYAAEEGQTPTTASAMTNYYFPYFKIDWWSQPTGLGGTWTWRSETGNTAIVLTGISAPEAQMRSFDRLVDDGNLATGAGTLINVTGANCYQYKTGR